MKVFFAKSKQNLFSQRPIFVCEFSNFTLINNQNSNQMKNKFMMFSTLIIIGAMLLTACVKTKEATVDKFIEVQNGTLVAKEKPSASSNVDLTVDMNQKVIPGGTSIVGVEATVEIKKIYVGVKEEYGYYEVLPESASNNIYQIVILVNQNIDLGEESTFVIWICILDENGEISEIKEKEVELHTVGTGQLQVSLTFNNAKDVDLHLFEPGDTENETGEHIYYGHRISANGGELDLDSNAGCSIDNVNNENITYGDSAYVKPGLYKVYVDLWSNCDPSVATDYVVTAIYDGTLIAVQSGSNPVNGNFPVDTPSNHADLNNLQPVMTFVIPDRGQKKTKTFAPAPPSQSAVEKMNWLK